MILKLMCDFLSLATPSWMEDIQQATIIPTILHFHKTRSYRTYSLAQLGVYNLSSCHLQA